jgi:phosphotransferase system IIA component
MIHSSDAGAQWLGDGIGIKPGRSVTGAPIPVTIEQFQRSHRGGFSLA